MRTKTELEERWRDVLNDYKEFEPKIRLDHLNPRKKMLLNPTSMLSGDLADLGRLEYLLNHNIVAFRQHLRESVQLKQQLYERYDKGEPIHPSYVVMRGYHNLFDALATGDMVLAREFARHLGGRPAIEKKEDHPFVTVFGYTLKSFVENAPDEVKQSWLEKFIVFCTHNKPFRTFLGYGTVFSAILEQDSEKANQGFKELIEGHALECKGKGDRYFKESPDEDIYFWGVGLANLAIDYGLRVKIDHPLIPEDLLLHAQ
jgi:hypothetical protein